MSLGGHVPQGFVRFIKGLHGKIIQIKGAVRRCNQRGTKGSRCCGDHIFPGPRSLCQKKIPFCPGFSCQKYIQSDNRRTDIPLVQIGYRLCQYPSVPGAKRPQRFKGSLVNTHNGDSAVCPPPLLIQRV